MGPVRDAGGSRPGPLSNALELHSWALPMLPSYVTIDESPPTPFERLVEGRPYVGSLGNKYAALRSRHCPPLLGS